MMSNLDAPIKTLHRTVKIVESYMGSCKENIRNLERSIKEKKKFLKSEKARLRRLEARKPMFEEGAKVLERELLRRTGRK